VLRTACLEGTDANVFLRGNLTDDENLVRDQVLAACVRARARALERDGEGIDRSGRSRLIFFSSLYGTLAGVQAEIALNVSFTDLRYYVVPPLVGMGIGLGSSILLTREGEITEGQTWTITSGYDYGSYLGLLWGMAEHASSSTLAGASLISGFTGGVAALAVAKGLHPSQGDAEIFRSGGLWGTAAGLFAGLLSAGRPVTLDDLNQSAALGMTLGLGAGALAARQTELSRQRVLLIDTGGLLGSLVGLSAVWLARGRDLQPRLAGGGGLLGLASGLAFASWATRNMDPAEQDDVRF